jgi:hypothetical protein
VKKSRKRPRDTPKVVATPVTAAELRQLKRELERRMRAKPPSIGGYRTSPKRSAGPGRWNPDPEEVQKSVAQLVLTIVEFLRQLMERQAIRRMENKTLTKKEIEDVGLALMRLEETVRDIGRRFGLGPEDLNLDIGLTKLM